MATTKILAAAAIAAVSSSAFANDGPSRSVDANPLGFIVQTQSGFLNQGLKSRAPAVQPARTAPVGRGAARRRPSS